MVTFYNYGYITYFKKRKTVVKAMCLHIAHDCNLACKYCFAEEGEYKLAVAIVQDEIQKSQTGGSSDYIHHSVLRGMLQEDTHGEYLGKQSDHEVLTLTYQYPIEKLDEKGKYRIIAYLLNKDEDGIYRVNNVTSCAIKESVGYQYETTDSK